MALTYTTSLPGTLKCYKDVKCTQELDKDNAVYRIILGPTEGFNGTDGEQVTQSIYIKNIGDTNATEVYVKEVGDNASYFKMSARGIIYADTIIELGTIVPSEVVQLKITSFIPAESKATDSYVNYNIIYNTVPAFDSEYYKDAQIPDQVKFKSVYTPSTTSDVYIRDDLSSKYGNTYVDNEAKVTSQVTVSRTVDHTGGIKEYTISNSTPATVKTSIVYVQSELPAPEVDVFLRADTLTDVYTKSDITTDTSDAYLENSLNDKKVWTVQVYNHYKTDTANTYIAKSNDSETIWSTNVYAKRDTEKFVYMKNTLVTDVANGSNETEWESLVYLLSAKNLETAMRIPVTIYHGTKDEIYWDKELEKYFVRLKCPNCGNWTPWYQLDTFDYTSVITCTACSKPIKVANNIDLAESSQAVEKLVKLKIPVKSTQWTLDPQTNIYSIALQGYNNAMAIDAYRKDGDIYSKSLLNIYPIEDYLVLDSVEAFDGFLVVLQEVEVSPDTRRAKLGKAYGKGPYGEANYGQESFIHIKDSLEINLPIEGQDTVMIVADFKILTKYTGEEANIEDIQSFYTERYMKLGCYDGPALPLKINML